VRSTLSGKKWALFCKLMETLVCLVSLLSHQKSVCHWIPSWGFSVHFTFGWLSDPFLKHFCSVRISAIIGSYPGAVPVSVVVGFSPDTLQSTSHCLKILSWGTSVQLSLLLSLDLILRHSSPAHILLSSVPVLRQFITFPVLRQFSTFHISVMTSYPEAISPVHTSVI
jgi:hypothetical protein